MQMNPSSPTGAVKVFLRKLPFHTNVNDSIQHPLRECLTEEHLKGWIKYLNITWPRQHFKVPRCNSCGGQKKENV